VPTPRASKPKAWTKQGYKVADAEKGNVHLIMEKRVFNQFSGEKASAPQKHIIDPKTWNTCRKVWPSQGWTVIEMLHVPNGCEHGFFKPEAKTEKEG
jgi:hypothetical protein